jgi:hypothetical protein
MKRKRDQPARDRRRPAPVICPACTATCVSAAERHHHDDCREARAARKRGQRPR